METKFAIISRLSAENPEMVFNQLMHHFNKENLLSWYQSLKGKAAVGIDGMTKGKYGENLEENLDALLRKLKTMSYIPGPVKQISIPKEGRNGATRPLGIGNFEDKIVQKGVQKILEAIYEPLFWNSSYGFRPKLGCHDAIKALRGHLYSQSVRNVIDLDLSNYFGTIDHDLLMAQLSNKIQDKRFLRYIRRMFKAGVLSNGELTVSDEGVPQGSICSPILANIYAHYALDDWFNRTVKINCRGRVEIFRYADDAVICCENAKDAERIRAALPKRLSKFKLKLNKDKTKTLVFNRFEKENSQSFDFLGFTFYLGLTKGGKVVPKLKSSGKKLRSKLSRVNEWCKENRNTVPLPELWESFCRKLAGHVQYYGISFNSKTVQGFILKSVKMFFKWINRRSQRKSMTFEKFALFMLRFPPPKAKIYHRLF
ncbi:MAG TPA: group II intron reverse transcriptase/maturase [Balneolaceae bacterium]|nr:group II intron reverse transcriptase/maturase [Balneolaceae bacterium]